MPIDTKNSQTSTSLLKGTITLDSKTHSIPKLARSNQWNNSKKSSKRQRVSKISQLLKLYWQDSQMDSKDNARLRVSDKSQPTPLCKRMKHPSQQSHLERCKRPREGLSGTLSTHSQSKTLPSSPQSTTRKLSNS